MRKIFKRLSLFSLSLVLAFSLFNIARSDDDEDESDDEDEYEESAPRTTTTASSSSNSKATTEIKVTTTSRDITYKDSDGDGILDIDDPHPKISEIYIVKDDNQNGIVDSFEVNQ